MPNLLVTLAKPCRSNLEDPYITLKEDDAASEEEDDTLKDSDLIILAARNEDDVSHLEVCLKCEMHAVHGLGMLRVHHSFLVYSSIHSDHTPDCRHGLSSSIINVLLKAQV